MYIFQTKACNETTLPAVFTVPFVFLLWSTFPLLFLFCPYPFIFWFVICLFLKMLNAHIVNLSWFAEALCAGRPWTLWSPVGVWICIANDWCWQNVMSYRFSFSNCARARALRKNISAEKKQENESFNNCLKLFDYRTPEFREGEALLGKCGEFYSVKSRNTRICLSIYRKGR